MWPAKVQHQFDIAVKEGNDTLENAFHGPYNKLLNTLFPVDSDFTVIPNVRGIKSSKDVDYLVTFEVHLDNRPVLVLELKHGEDFHVASKRIAADTQLKQRLGDLVGDCPLSTLRGISAFGTKLCFYSITKADNQILLPSAPSLDQRILDTAPAERWSMDILSPEGEAEFRKTIQVITGECAQL